MSDTRLQRYVNEFSGRHNIRELDSLDQRKMVVRQTDLNGYRERIWQTTEHLLAN